MHSSDTRKATTSQEVDAVRLSKPTYFLTFVLVLGLGLGVAYQVPLARGQVADAAALGSPDQPSAAAVRAFWTPARMAAARPA